MTSVPRQGRFQLGKITVKNGVDDLITVVLVEELPIVAWRQHRRLLLILVIGRRPHGVIFDHQTGRDLDMPRGAVDLPMGENAGVGFVGLQRLGQ